MCATSRTTRRSPEQQLFSVIELYQDLQDAIWEASGADVKVVCVGCDTTDACAEPFEDGADEFCPICMTIERETVVVRPNHGPTTMAAPVSLMGECTECGQLEFQDDLEDEDSIRFRDCPDCGGALRAWVAPKRGGK